MMSAIFLEDLVISVIAETADSTTCPPRSAAWRAPLASCAACRALSAFCFTVELISSRLAAVSSRLAACSWAPLLIDSALEASCEAADQTSIDTSWTPASVVCIASSDRLSAAAICPTFVFAIEREPDREVACRHPLEDADRSLQRIGDRAAADDGASDREQRRHRKPRPGRAPVCMRRFLLKAAAKEFADADHDRGRRNYSARTAGTGMDMVVMPPSFPVGGMGNPRLSFISPTIIAGDKSLPRSSPTNWRIPGREIW